MTGRRLGLAELLKRTAKEIQEDHLAAFAGNLTYKGLFALFPFFVFLLSLLGLFGAPDLLQTLIEQARGVLPQGAIDFLEGQLLGIAGNKAQGAFTAGALVSILLALGGVPIGHGGYERYVRDRGGTPVLEAVDDFCLPVFGCRRPPPLRARARRLRPRDRGRRCRCRGPRLRL